MSPEVQRKLTTILAADAEGYSHEMDADEVRALDALRGAYSPSHRTSPDVDEFFESLNHGDSVWSGAKPFTTKIRRNIRLAEAPSFGQSIFHYAPKSHGAEDYQNLARELLATDLMQCRRRTAVAA